MKTPHVDGVPPTITPAAARTSAEWQPIETAPTDGSRVLLYGQAEGGSPFVGYYGCAGWGKSEWIEATTGLEAFNAPHRPTHWMPLPYPPEGAA